MILKRIKFAKQRRKRICWIRKIRNSCSQILLNIGVLEIFANFTGKCLCWSLVFNKDAGLQLYYKRLQHRCFPVKFVKLFRIPFFTEHLRWLLLENLFRSSRERRIHITGEIYAVIWQSLLLLLFNNRHATIREAWVRKKINITASEVSTLELGGLGGALDPPSPILSSSGSREEPWWGSRRWSPRKISCFWSLRYPRLSDFKSKI